MNITVSPPADILHELEQLAWAPQTDVNHLRNTPANLRFVELCQTRYPQISSGSMLRFSLASALRQLGLACLVGGQGSELVASAAEIPKPTKLALNTTLRTYVEQRLAGVVMTSSRAPVLDPSVPWKGRRYGPRKDLRWARAWSPEQIARRLPIDFPHERRCASATKPSIKPSSFRAGERCAAN